MRVTTAGKTSRLVRTERTLLTAKDFAAAITPMRNQSSETVKMLVYGDSNAGKTVLAGTLPKRTLWLTGEPGFKSAIRWRQRQELPPHIGARSLTDTAMAWAAVQWLEENAGNIDWLVVDGASTMQDRFRLSYAAEAFDIDPSKRQHRNLPDRPDYFNTQNFMKAWFARLVDLPVNLLVTAHAYRTDETETGELLVFPGFQGKVTEVANAISGLMDITAYYERRRIRNKEGQVSTVRQLWFESPKREDVRYICGEKYGVLGTHMVSPTMSKIMERIEA